MGGSDMWSNTLPLDHGGATRDARTRRVDLLDSDEDGQLITIIITLVMQLDLL